MTFAFCCDTALLFVQHAVILSSVVQIIKDLGGHALDSATWDSRCSHLIAGSANRSEKYLAACASGAWVLRPSFIEASQQAGAFFLSLPPQTSGGWGTRASKYASTLKVIYLIMFFGVLWAS